MAATGTQRFNGGMRVEAVAASLSWIPSASVAGLLRRGFDLRLSHYDDPPPDVLADVADVHALRDADGFRFANVLAAWAEFDAAGSATSAGYLPVAGLVMGSTTVRLGPLGVTFRATSLPTLRPDPELGGDAVRVVQTVGGRTGVPIPRPVPEPPYVQWAAPTVWTTLAVTFRADGTTAVELPGASAFPRHWVYGTDGRLALKSGMTDQDDWEAHSFGARTPWGAHDSPTLVVAAETALEREMSTRVMRGGACPAIQRLAAGEVLVRQGEAGTALFVLLDGVVAVDVDGTVVAELGPGAVVGERAVLEGGRRTSTLVARTPVRVAVAASDALDLDRLRELAEGHRREVTG